MVEANIQWANHAEDWIAFIPIANKKHSGHDPIQESRSGIEFGIVGFREKKGATYLVFPKSLKRFADKRIVGVNWALVGQ